MIKPLMNRDIRQCQLSVFVTSAAYCWFEPNTIRLTEDPELNLTSEHISWLISIIQVGCITSSLVSGDLTNRIGRKYVIMSIGPLCIAGWILILCSKSMPSLILARIFHGLSTGVAFTITPIYTAEIAEPKLRGSLSGIFMSTWNLGVLYAFSFGPYLSYDEFIYVCLPLPITFTIIWMFMPETPYYLLMKGQEDEARKVLKYFRNGDIDEELEEMKNAVREEMSTEGSWKILFTDEVERKAFIIVQIVCITKYLGGLTVLVNYALDIFSKSESFLPAEEMSILLASVITLIALVSGFMSDWIGRRPLLLISCFGCFFAHFITGGYYYVHEKTTFDTSRCTWVLYIGLSMYCFFSDIGITPLMQILQSEMFGASTRGVAAGITEGFASVLTFVVLKAYSPVNEAYGIYINFWFYSLVALVGGILLSWLLYETAGKTIGRMENKPTNRAVA
ncbi:facilitated trehalose transporter Tret1 [Halyomorpha halys]|uniref:facilitated trehalose transporter Tret1 n=1 Tax=Halyomorpha halys TaxID=286706 RepID=UPI0006D514A0|nr:facilitated trehalose transporter Tret1-like [Halyomorpha halys]XP_024218960.1 facilitated trehalose transporter Tret1-like [Halyomorpha halys]